VVPEVHAVLDKMSEFAGKVRSGAWLGHSGKRIKNIRQHRIAAPPGAGHGLRGAARLFGSRPHAAFRFKVDATDFAKPCKSRCRRTLFIVCSKTFTTIETLKRTPARRGSWLVEKLGDQAAGRETLRGGLGRTPRSSQIGIDTANMFASGIGSAGRYSYPSAIAFGW